MKNIFIKTSLQSLIILFSIALFANDNLAINNTFLNLDFEDPEIINNTISFDGVNTLTGSNPSGGNGVYSYSWQIWVSGSGTGENSFSGDSKSLVLTSGQAQLLVDYELGVYFRRIIISGDQISYSNWSGGDSDGDGIENLIDNCPLVANPNQNDADNDGIGDICDDGDRDGVLDINDNCVNTANPDQADDDGDGIGNTCDNCDFMSNTDQTDNDNDGVGDICDNCPDNSNSSQTDTDGDGIGNSCDSDDDNDGILDSQDSCPLIANSGVDADNDGIDDACDDEVGFPNISLSTILMVSDCFDCSQNISDGDIHEINYGNGIFSFNFIQVGNDGLGSSSPTKIRCYISKNSTLDSSDTALDFDISVPLINGNGQEIVSGSAHITYNTLLNGEQLTDSSTYYLLIKLDPDNTSGDSTTELISVGFKYYSGSSSRQAYLNSNNNLIEIPLEDQNTTLSKIKTNNLKVYSLSAPLFPVVNQNVINNETVNILNLSKGIYIIHINNSYVKKFKI